MDGITEPVVLVLGHPIAGNPSQFVLERAIRSLGLPWRVLSCDVAADQVQQAMDGAEVLGFRALLLDRNLVSLIGEDESPRDFYFRERQGPPGWQSEDLLRIWLEQAIQKHFASLELPIGTVLSIGTPDSRVPYDLATSQTQSPIAWASTEDVQKTDWIVMTESVQVADWPENDGATLVVDLAAIPNDADQIRSKGYAFLGMEEARVGVLRMCLHRLTGEQPDLEMVVEAIEEYLAV